VFGRVAIYSEWTVPSQDWKALGTALAAPARLDAGPTGWTLEAPVPVWLTSAEDRDYFLDGRLWPAVSPEGLLAPAGRHRLTVERPWLQLRERAEELTRVLYLSGELLEARSRRTGVEVHYRSPSRAVLLLNQKPLGLLVDGRRAPPAWEPAGGGVWALLVPRGEHRVEVETFTSAGVLVNVWGAASASAIAAFGALTTALMIGIYLHLRVRRPARRGEGA
ncbi:MAG: hypothetical protein HY238_24605, partial [Acidobacteria bacterium]|nr:hypothetical protein [Acidobacteriota bacterium]